MNRPLHIALDARWIFPEISGIGLYTQELIAALVRLNPAHRFTLLFNHAEVAERTARETGYVNHPAFTAHLLGHGPFSPRDQWTTPRLLRDLGVDVFHATNSMMPLRGMGPIRRVVTIHDLIPLLFRDHAPRSKKNRLFPVYRWLMHRVARQADALIAVSDHTRRDIEAHLLPPVLHQQKIHVIHEGVRTVYTPARKPERDHVEFLYVGRRDPYKNLPLLIRCLDAVRKRGHPARLRVVGGDDARYPEARQAATALRLDDAITWSGYIPDADLVTAYQRADVFVLPSRYEGFGLPVLEAMACGTPVICSNSSSLPEVAGDAALLIDPDRPDTLTDAMVRLARDARLRELYARYGITRAATFTWEKTARQTLVVYESLTP